MTAIGFVLVFAGWLIGSMFGATRGTTNKADYVAGALSFFGLIALQHGRQYLGCELNPEYGPLQQKRVMAVMGGQK